MGATSLTATIGVAPSDDLLTGGRLLRQAFHEAPHRTAFRDDVIISADDRTPSALLIKSGSAYSSHNFIDGRRSIIDLSLPTDMVGVERAVFGRPGHDVVAATMLGYRLMPAQTLRSLMQDPRVAARVMATIVEAKRRIEQHVVTLTRLDARSRIAALLIGVYDRLRRADLIARSTFNLHLSQDQIGDHLGITPVHVSRTLRLMREERLAIVNRGVVIIHDVERLRAVATTELPQASPDKKVGDVRAVAEN